MVTKEHWELSRSFSQLSRLVPHGSADSTLTSISWILLYFANVLQKGWLDEFLDQIEPQIEALQIVEAPRRLGKALEATEGVRYQMAVLAIDAEESYYADLNRLSWVIKNLILALMIRVDLLDGVTQASRKFIGQKRKTRR